MPWTPKQKGLFGADLGRLKAGKKTKTGMDEEELEKALQEGTRKALNRKLKGRK